MNRKMIKSFSAFAIVISMVAGSALPIITAFAETYNTVSVGSVEEFSELAKNCTLDTWSRGKTVSLTGNIDFSGKEFAPIPYFNGVFEGNGYTISGVKYTRAGSNIGLFRYIGSEGTVRNLNVQGKLSPVGTKAIVGGIVGQNNGTIDNCTYYGSVEGDSKIGGIAGQNNDSGKIVSSSADGSVSGRFNVGGIAGYNSGSITASENKSNVNTSPYDDGLNINNVDTDAGAVIDRLTSDSSTDIKEKLTLSRSNAGGIAGFTSGIIESCTNQGTIGYSHVGYNIGGIAGCQTGYILGSENYGTIYGRKDVGGIAGQAEPYIVLDSSASVLDQLNSELGTLKDMTDSLINKTDNAADDISNGLSSIHDYSQGAIDNTQTLLDDTTDFADTNLDVINTLSMDISDTLDKLTKPTDDISDSFSSIKTSLTTIRDALDSLNLYYPDDDKEIEQITNSLKKLADASSALGNAMYNLDKGIVNLKKGIVIKNSAQVETALKSIGVSLKTIIQSNDTIISEIEKILPNLDTSTMASEELENLKSSLTTIKDAIVAKNAALRNIMKSISEIAPNVTINMNRLRTAAIQIEFFIDNMESAAADLNSGLKGLSTAIDSLHKKLKDYADDMTSQLNNAFDKIADGLDGISYSSGKLSGAFSEISDIMDNLSSKEPYEFVKLGDNFRENNDKLFDNLSGISNEMNSLKDSVHASGKDISSMISGLNKQFNTIMDLVIGELRSINEKDTKTSLSDYIDDVSDEDISSLRLGKLKSCKNHGKIEADRNVGGVVGAMAIEYENDPEGDIPHPTLFDYTYRTKAVLEQCMNDGNVIGKKDCIGGIVGDMSLGTVFLCENYGSAEADGGNYVGGVAGKSTSSVRNCYSKAKVSGGSYVGGIVGSGEKITGCYAISSVSGDEYIGSIAGNDEKRNKASGNYFVDNGVGGIDSISYSGCAEPVTYDEMKAVSGIPSKFISFAVRFVIDSKETKVYEAEYGEPTERIPMPEIPDKSDGYGKWQLPEDEEFVTQDMTIEAEYIPWVTILASNENTDDGKLALALAEGKFKEDAAMSVSDSSIEPPETAKIGETKVWNIRMTGTELSDSDTTRIRLVNKDKSRVHAWKYTESGEWEKVKLTNKGKYVCTDINGTSATICLTYTTASNIAWIVVLVICAVLAILAFIFRKKLALVIRRKKTD